MKTEVLTSTVGMKDETKGRMVQKAKASFFFNISLYVLGVSTSYFTFLWFLLLLQIEIVLSKSDKFDSLVPPVTNGKTPEEEAKADTEAAVEAQEEVAATEA